MISTDNLAPMRSNTVKAIENWGVLVQQVIITDKDFKWCMKHYPQFSNKCEFFYMKSAKQKKWRRAK